MEEDISTAQYFRPIRSDQDIAMERAFGDDDGDDDCGQVYEDDHDSSATELYISPQDLFSYNDIQSRADANPESQEEKMYYGSSRQIAMDDSIDNPSVKEPVSVIWSDNLQNIPQTQIVADVPQQMLPQHAIDSLYQENMHTKSGTRSSFNDGKKTGSSMPNSILSQNTPSDIKASEKAPMSSKSSRKSSPMIDPEVEDKLKSYFLDSIKMTTATNSKNPETQSRTKDQDQGYWDENLSNWLVHGTPSSAINASDKESDADTVNEEIISPTSKQQEHMSYTPQDSGNSSCTSVWFLSMVMG